MTILEAFIVAAIMAEKFFRLNKTSWLISGGIAALAVLLGSGWLIVGRWLLQAPSPDPSLSQISLAETDQALISEVEADLPNPAPATQIPVAAQSLPRKLDAAKLAAQQGLLRISNLTDYPVRVALLGRKSGKVKPSDRFKLPAHWDFSPQEGGLKGLVVSLPNQAVEVKPGDVLVAFSEDGSRRYWGPYIIGETAFPSWSKQMGEWQLTLQP